MGGEPNQADSSEKPEYSRENSLLRVETRTFGSYSIEIKKLVRSDPHYRPKTDKIEGKK